MTLVDIFKALGDENRLRIMNLLLNQELCVCELEAILGLSQSNVSRHLTKLKQAKLIESSKEAQWIHYKANEKVLSEMIGLVALLKKHGKYEPFQSDLNKLDKYLKHHLTCTDIRERYDYVQATII
jgi:ArsR family transcriptional regulator